MRLITHPGLELPFFFFFFDFQFSVHWILCSRPEAACTQNSLIVESPGGCQICMKKEAKKLQFSRRVNNT